MMEERNINQPEEDSNSIRGQMEAEKLRLEIDKLKNENRELTKPILSRPQYIAALSPIIVGILTLIVAWWSGFLQAQSKLNEVQKLSFQQEKVKYQDSIKKFQDDIKKISDKSYLDSLRGTILVNSIDSLKLLETKAKQKLDSFLSDNRNASEKVLSLIKENGLLQDRLSKLTETLSYVTITGEKYRKIVDSLAYSKNTIVIPSSYDMRISPNPVIDTVSIEINTPILNNVSIVISDLDGKIVYSKEIVIKYFSQREKINLSSLQKGTYIIVAYFKFGDRRIIKMSKL